MNGLVSRCEKRERLETHVCRSAGSLGYWHALHRAIHIWIRCCSPGSFLCSLTLDYKALRIWQSQVIGEALIWMCCQRVIYGSCYLEHAFVKVSVSLVTAQPRIGSKWHRTGLLTKCCKRQEEVEEEEKKERERERDQIVCLCTHCIPSYLYRVKKLCRLHVSTWWELLNYWWMFLITSHKCWNTTLLQCLEEEEGGL